MKENLILDNIKLIYYVLKKMHLGSESDEYFDIGMIGLCKAANTYDTDKKIAFTTYAYKCITTQILCEIRDRNSNKSKINYNTISLSKPIAMNGDREMLVENVLANDINIEEEICYKETLEELDKCINKLPPREKVILTYHYGLNGVRKHTQYEIADILKISQSQVSRSIKKGIKMLRETMCKCL